MTTEKDDLLRDIKQAVLELGGYRFPDLMDALDEFTREQAKVPASLSDSIYREILTEMIDVSRQAVPYIGWKNAHTSLLECCLRTEHLLGITPPLEPATQPVGNAVDAPVDECREAFQSRYHKVRARVDYDEWKAIWALAQQHQPSPANSAGSAETVAVIVRDVCETLSADPEHEETICIRVGTLTDIIERHLIGEDGNAQQSTEGKGNDQNRN